MHGINLLFLALAGASASPAFDKDTPTETATTTTEESQPSTTTTAGTESVPSDRPLPTCDGQDGSDCISTSTSSYIEGGQPPEVTGECSGTSTYVGSTPPTVTSTVTETYTVSGNDVQMGDGPSIITPPPPCSATVVPGWGIPMDDFTSTVMVTKKTAVPYSEPTDPPSFTDPPDSDPQTTAPPDSDNNGDGDVDCEDFLGMMCNLLPPDSSDSPDGGCSNSDSDCDSDSDESSSSSGNAPSESASGPSSPDPNSDEDSDNEGEKADNNDSDSKNDGSISQIDVSGVPVVISPSRIQVGGQLITDFRNAPTPTTLVSNGQKFTINESEVIGPKTTIPIPSGQANSGPDSDSDSDSNQEPTYSPLTVGDLTFSIGPSEAIISGTTLTIGPDSTPTTTVIDGETVSVGPDGLGFPSTTIAPPTAPPTGTETGQANPRLSTSSLLSSIAALLPFFGAWGLI